MGEKSPCEVSSGITEVQNEQEKKSHHVGSLAVQWVIWATPAFEMSRIWLDEAAGDLL